MFWTRTIPVLVAVFLVLGLGESENTESKEPKETYVGLFERTIRPLATSKRMLEQGIAAFRNDLRTLRSHLIDQDDKNRTTIADVLNPIKFKIKAIFPGTYWCGDGNISPNKGALGLFKKTDACCKAHDSCPKTIPSNGEKDGLKNNGIFTRSHCDCDKEFYQCLKEANTIIATDIGTTYFNILRPQCFKSDYPVENCKRYARRRVIDDKCVEYNYDRDKSEKMQWFDNPDFIGI
ncbi:phospholipase A2-like [Colletes latitarsis]|uniref:phospholipase A2-like n=1 Tax=Colletes latitarsis TaxID=2605962 RepID=UPI004036EF47